MASTLSSWHPAFMPNSESPHAISSVFPNEEADPSPQPAVPVSASGGTNRANALDDSVERTSDSPAEDHISQVTLDHNATSPSSAEDSGARPPDIEGLDTAANDSSNEGNSTHPELGNLRDALKTSLASPGGVEMDEIPKHSESRQEVAKAEEILERRRAEHSSTGPTPAHEPGHTSSASFTRTVPQDVDWGEDDEVDPEWNIHRRDTDPFKMMPMTNRSNSFPAVPPTHYPNLDRPLPQSQAEDIMNLVDHPRDSAFEAETHDGDGAVRGSAEDLSRTTISDEHRDGVDPDYDRSYGRAAPETADVEDRYEEGIPLVAGSRPPELLAAGEQTLKSVMFADETAEEQDEFFSRIGLNEPTEPPSQPALERKSTMQVLDALNLQPDDEVGDREDNPKSPRSAFEGTLGDEISLSENTALSQIFGDSDVNFLEEESSNAGNKEPSQEDLAAKWQAALADDEFLDDDEGLLDDEVGPENGIDPTALFGSEDEGFLEDEEETDSSASHQITSVTSPETVTDTNGQVLGLDNIARRAHASQPNSQSRYLPAGTSQSSSQPTGNTYIPAAPLLTDLSSRGSNFTPTYNSGGPVAAIAPTTTADLQSQDPRPGMPKAQSFVNQAKGGYSSPYDLPMDVVKPRKRPSMQQIGRGYTNPAQSVAPAAPPRSSSMLHQGSPPSRGSGSSIKPPTTSQSFQQPSGQMSQTPPTSSQTVPPVLKSNSSFFEDLPITSRPKPAGRYTPQPKAPVIAAQPPPFASTPQEQASPPSENHSQASLGAPPVNMGLVAPAQVSPYTSMNGLTTQTPPVTSRYSPAPPQAQGATPPPMNQTRYAAAPPLRQRGSFYSAPPPSASSSTVALPHQPRTSSPLAHFERSQDRQPHNGPGGPYAQSGPERRDSSSHDSVSRMSSLPITREVEGQDLQADQGFDRSMHIDRATYHSPPQPQTSLPPQASTPPTTSSMSSLSPPKYTTTNYLRETQHSFSQERASAPPQRPQTQSPGKVMLNHVDMSHGEPYQRPFSAYDPAHNHTQNTYASTSSEAPEARKRAFSQGLKYIAPTDGREHDPLQRWRGGPVFAWGVGGTVVTSFPKEVPRYGSSQTLPMIVCSPGEVKIRNLRDLCPLQDRLSSFPGPLKGKSKKKDVISWLTVGIDMLEHENSHLQGLPTLTHEDKRKEERVLLWKILRVLIENDGVLEGNLAVNKSVCAVLSPSLDTDTTPQYRSEGEQAGIFKPDGSTARAEAVDAAAVDNLRRLLLRGERERAVWEAVDKRLWAHAMLISNTLSKDLYKQVVQEFVQKEVKNIGENTESLAALYEVFAGNFEESVDELVPPSARAGFQMVSPSGLSGPSRDALDGLDRWRETLGLVLSNRSPDDNHAICALGKLLSGYGRAEAAHICFIFARDRSVFGGSDDPSSNVVLVGSDHLQQPLELDKEIEPVLLSEVYEYGLSLSATSNMPSGLPHLAIYKLQHATVLAEVGQRDKALQYCEAIASSITSQTRRSPYHHALLVSSLDDLSKRLKQSPKDESSSWISKPSIDKVSGSVWAKFNKFVAGDENDTTSGAAGTDDGSDVGPFARIAGGTPTISRSPSHAEIYGSYNGGSGFTGSIPIPAATRSASRYSPAGSYTAAHFQDHAISSSYGSQSHNLYSSSGARDDSPLQEIYRSGLQRSQTEPQMAPHSPNYGQQEDIATPFNNAYIPDSRMQGGNMPYAPTYTSPRPATASEPAIPASEHDLPRSMPNSDSYLAAGTYSPPDMSFQPQSNGGYAPPESGGYTPASYEPVSMTEEPASPVDSRPKKSFMDDDGGDYQSVSKTTEKSKAEKDREADEAFRKAAEADAQKAQAAAPPKKGWGLAGWFGGGKKEPAADASQANKPIKAKLGEASSFYYDPDLKRWVNKKAGKDDPSASTGSTPPPPRAGPPRTPSGSGTPSIAPTSAPRPTPPTNSLASQAISRTGSSQVQANQSAADLNGLALPPAMSRTVSNGSATGPPSAPPSRPATSLSNASSIDDLLGPPTARKAAGKKAKKGRGYIDVMGDKGSA
ncbi:MAG: vesicle coat component [Claussenomyces sp. TS43310]|nr:MAG: vesicle coat component [Claussenomyces sp. TS43310]